jgi:hypothetical protein
LPVKASDFLAFHSLVEARPVFGFHFCGGARVARSLVFSRSVAVFLIFLPGARVRAAAGLILGLLRFWSGSILHALRVCAASRRFPLLALKFCAVFFHARSGLAAAARDPFFRVIFPLVFSSCVGLSWCNQFKRQRQIKSSTGFGFGCVAKSRFSSVLDLCRPDFRQ